MGLEFFRILFYSEDMITLTYSFVLLLALTGLLLNRQPTFARVTTMK